ncbi:Helix-turn-helix domain-containing protein [Streptoalloteichus tenebrarius]|uniref:Helix-turn-helix domain-containing protein n=1 Tax=Streptoalloteichus tenebrarius (strain ATCC 17920 / DSM 40477 / JCM 4838 / CBS 697.72 / NBRC 16177 / NCIMB 11028 / NRRL B-12390 / A12253. 1 / ISP 5477) TaxID=1933 RepID=A0ABT1HUI2_STRSD|nr:AraC family transcriptional regulator [Streptoalloteichus tenebrarius]MCP2259085.1 Helix-turn-helix domain-containing protein [Streptoalloteichus tenebrarius]BFE99589.1 AraC family transcriptional regulator [Streptoalloteichus tenebrarius]
MDASSQNPADFRSGGAVCVRPPAALTGLTRGWVGYREHLASTVRRQEIPTSTVLLVVAFGDPVSVGRAGDEGRGRAFTFLVVGPRDRTVVLGGRGDQHGVLVRLDPLDAYSLLGFPLGLVSNDVTDLESLLGRPGGRLVERLAEERSWRRRFAVLADTLARLITAGPVPDPAVVLAWRRLRDTAGGIRIATLGDQLGLSRRHLVRRFHQQIGLPPKTVARIFRFEHALTLMGADLPSMADVAAAAGYSDQAHLSREARALVHCAPSEIAAMRGRALAGGMSHLFKP